MGIGQVALHLWFSDATSQIFQQSPLPPPGGGGAPIPPGRGQVMCDASTLMK